MKKSSDGETLMVVGIWFQQRRKCNIQSHFYPGNVQERLTRGTERRTGLMVGYEIMKFVPHLLNSVQAIDDF